MHTSGFGSKSFQGEGGSPEKWDDWIICARDADGSFVLVIRQFEDNFHVRCKGIVGKTDEEILPAHIAVRHRATDQQILATGRALEREESVLINGTAHDFASIHFPVGGAGPPWSGVACIAANISRRTSKLLTPVWARPRLQHGAAFVLDASGRINGWNFDCKQLFRYREREMLGRHVSVLYSPQDVESGLTATTPLAAVAECVYEGLAWRRSKNGSTSTGQSSYGGTSGSGWNTRRFCREDLPAGADSRRLG